MEIKRNIYLDRLIRREKNGLIKIVTGVRRCGKSYLLFNLFHNYLLDEGVKEDHIIEIALDDRSNKELRDPDNMLNYVKERIVDKDTYYIILDEVQLLAEFEDVLNSFMHIRRRLHRHRIYDRGTEGQNRHVQRDARPAGMRQM